MWENAYKMILWLQINHIVSFYVLIFTICSTKCVHSLQIFRKYHACKIWVVGKSYRPRELNPRRRRRRGEFFGRNRPKSCFFFSKKCPGWKHKKAKIKKYENPQKSKNTPEKPKKVTFSVEFFGQIFQGGRSLRGAVLQKKSRPLRTALIIWCNLIRKGIKLTDVPSFGCQILV